MTMPSERARALRKAGELLRVIQSTPDVDPKLRLRAESILRHYPTANDIKVWAKDYGTGQLFTWLGPEESDSVTRLKGMFGKTNKTVSVEEMNPLSEKKRSEERKSTDAE